MATTELSGVRTAIAARIVALSADWKESKFVPDRLGLDPASVAHQAFSVDLPAGHTTGGRQRQSLTQSETVIVRFTWQVKPKDQVTSYDDGLNAERALMNQLIAPSWTSTFQLLYVNSSRLTLETGEWRRHVLTFNALLYLTTE